VRKKIAVFAGASVKENSPLYKDAVETGRIIGKNFDIICGGYGGLMEGVSKGVSEARGKCYGIGFKAFDKKKNIYIYRMKKASSLSERLDYFLKNADAFIALPGGVGTICEVMFLWDNMKAGLCEIKPLLLYGRIWNKFLTRIKTDFLIPEKSFRLLKYAENKSELKNFLSGI